MLDDCIEKIIIVFGRHRELEAESVFHNKWSLEESPFRVCDSEGTFDFEDHAVYLLRRDTRFHQTQYTAQIGPNKNPLPGISYHTFATMSPKDFHEDLNSPLTISKSLVSSELMPHLLKSV